MADSPISPQEISQLRYTQDREGRPSSAVSENWETSFVAAETSDRNEAQAFRARTGDHQAFARLYSLHKRRIYSLCLRMVSNAAEAEDLTQEAFLQLHRKIGTFRGESAFSTWLHRLAINMVLMQIRKKGLPLISLDEAMEPTARDGPGRSFGAPDPAPNWAIDRLALERAVASLPAGYRLIFVLHDIEGFEHNEIAAMLDCSICNSKSQLHKAPQAPRGPAHRCPEGGGPAMTAESSRKSCAEFQAQLAEPIGSGENVAEHPPYPKLRAVPCAVGRYGDHCRSRPQFVPGRRTARRTVGPYRVGH